MNSGARFLIHGCFTVVIMMQLLSCGGSGSDSEPAPTSSNTGTNGAGGNTASGGATQSGNDTASNGTENSADIPVAVDIALVFSDDFSTDTLADWSRRHVEEGTAAQYSVLDINRTTTGALTLVPNLTPGWFADGDAPLIFKRVDGNFSIETEVLAETLSGAGLAPTANFNSGGLMARNPAGATGPENHIMVNVGRQDDRIINAIGSESKTTVNSNSTLALQAGTNRGRLVLCRVGDEFFTYRFLDNETQWTQIGAATRADLPATLQVGMVANGFSGPDVRVTFDYIQLHVPATQAECLRAQ